LHDPEKPNIFVITCIIGSFIKRKMLKHPSIVNTIITFFLFVNECTIAHVIVVYECDLARSADMLRQLSGRASDLHAVGSGFNYLSDFIFYN